MADNGVDLSAAYAQALDASAGGLLILNAHGTIMLVNTEAQRLFGYQRDELIGRPVDVLLPEAAGPIRVLAAEGRVFDRQADDGRLVLFGLRKDGARVAVRLALRPVQTADDRFVVASVVPISETADDDPQSQAKLEVQLALDRFIADLSWQFINLPPEMIDPAIVDGLRQACHLLGLEQATFVRIAPDGAPVRAVSWSAPGVMPLEEAFTAGHRFPWTLATILAGEPVCFSDPAEIPHETDRASFTELGTRSSFGLPLSVEGRVTAFVGFFTVHSARVWTTNVRQRLAAIATVFAQAVARQRRDEALQAVTDEAHRLKHQLQTENVYLRQETRQPVGIVRIVGQSAALRGVLDNIKQVAPTDSTVLLLGETGTGKELFASEIHELSARRGRAMVRVNCAAIPATLIESELFGRERGAFTGALARQVGRFELADRSTIFLDEIGDLPLDAQVKLLRVLEERKFERLGSPRAISVDVRVIAATHRNLEAAIADGAFREDLYYRLNVFPIHVPPLRERPEDIPLLVWRFVEEFSRAFGKRIDAIDKETLLRLQRYSWPGNIRELRNVIERAMIVTASRRLAITPPSAPPAVKRSPKLADVEREHIAAVLESTNWRIRGSGGAADRLGMKPTTLETRMAKLALKRRSQT